MKKKSSEYIALHRQMTSYINSKGDIFICLTCEVVNFPFERISKIPVCESFFNDFRMMRLSFERLLHLFFMLSSRLGCYNAIRRQNNEKCHSFRVVGSPRSSFCYYPSDEIPF